MSDSVIAAIIAAVPPTITALVGLLYVRGLHKKINSRMDDLIVVIRKDARAEGVIEGRNNRIQ